MSTITTSNVTTPAPILRIDNYPKAPAMSSGTLSTISISLPTLQYHIQTASLSLGKEQEEREYTILTTTNKKHMYYYQEPSILQREEQEEGQPKEEVIFYNQYQKPIWKLMNRDWHGMTLIYQKQVVSLSTTPPPEFRFTFNQSVYYWQAAKVDTKERYILKCFEAESKKIIAHLEKDQILLDIPPVLSITEEAEETNPFRKSTLGVTTETERDDPFSTLVVISGLLVKHHIKILLKSLGGGPEALQMILEPPPSPMQEEDDVTSISSRQPYYPGHQSLVERPNNNSRWSSSATSFKSIELDPGVWHCWWGYKFWWSWFPCCMPGGLCDRACIRLKGGHRSTARSKTLSKQGWQQQHY